MNRNPGQTASVRGLALIALIVFTGSAIADVLYVSYGDRTGYSRPNIIEKFDSVTGADLGVFANTGLSLPQGLAFDRAGNLFVANYGNNTIQKFTPLGVGSLFAHTDSGPGSLVFDSQGNLYVANYWGNTIQKFTPEGVGSVFANTGIHYPTGMTIDQADNLYVANGNTLTIQKFTPGGVGSVFAHTGPFSAPLSGLACDAAGNIYLGCQAGSMPGIMKYSPDGVGSVFSYAPSTATGMVFDSNGNLFGADYGWNEIEKITPSGGRTVLARTPASPWGIAIQPVPEPSTFALLALGFLGLLASRNMRVR